MLKKMKFIRLVFLLSSLLLLAQCALERVPRSPYDQYKYVEGKETSILKQECSLMPNDTIRIACTFGCNTNYKKAAKLAAKDLGYKIEFIPLNKDKNLKSYNIADAFIIEGGADIQPYLYDKTYGIEGLPPELLATINPDLSENEKLKWKNKDLFEYHFLKNYFKQEKFKKTPLLGICRGMQMLSVVNDIPLYADLKKQLDIDNLECEVNQINITDENSTTYEIFKNLVIEAHQYHHQGFHLEYFLKNRKNYPHINVIATSANGKIAEVIEFNNRKVIGTQFHPERSGLKVKKGYFKWLLIEACKGKTKELTHPTNSSESTDR